MRLLTRGYFLSNVGCIWPRWINSTSPLLLHLVVVLLLLKKMVVALVLVAGLHSLSPHVSRLLQTLSHLHSNKFVASQGVQHNCSNSFVGRRYVELGMVVSARELLETAKE